MPIVSWSWREGRYWDLWSITHIVTGAIFAVAGELIGLSLFVTFVIAVLLMSAWELFETVIQVLEGPENRILDIIVGIIGFLIILPFLPSEQNAQALLLMVLIVLVGMLEFLGWRAYRKRSKKNTNR